MTNGTLLPLKNGEWTNDPRLDRCKQVDIRSLNYLAQKILTADQYSEPRSYTWRVVERLDQGNEGACVGFAFAHELAGRPGVVTGVTNDYARTSLYWEFQKRDPWPGGSYPGASPFYEGTSVLAGAMYVLGLGLYKEVRWALNINDLMTAVGYHGPAVIGVDWYEGMFRPDADGFIHPTGRIMGGHAVCVPSVKIIRNKDGSVDMLRSYFTIQNSWGADWGQDGRCKITFAEMLVLWPGGDFAIPVGRAKAVAE